MRWEGGWGGGGGREREIGEGGCIPEHGEAKMGGHLLRTGGNQFSIVDSKHIEDGNPCQPNARDGVIGKHMRQSCGHPCQQSRVFVEAA